MHRFCAPALFNVPKVSPCHAIKYLHYVLRYTAPRDIWRGDARGRLCARDAVRRRRGNIILQFREVNYSNFFDVIYAAA